MKRDPRVCEWFVCTQIGDRLSTLQRSYLMTFREKILWSEESEQIFPSSASRPDTIAESNSVDPRQKEQ